MKKTITACDKCGKEIKNNETCGQAHIPDTIEALQVVTIKHYDICPSCVAKFEAWINEKPNTVHINQPLNQFCPGNNMIYCTVRTNVGSTRTDIPNPPKITIP